MQYLIILIIGFYLWYSNIATETEKQEANKVVKQVIGVDKSNVYNSLEALKEPALSFTPYETETSRFKIYNSLQNSHKIIDKYIKYNGSTSFSNDVIALLNNIENQLNFISNDIDSFKKRGNMIFFVNHKKYIQELSEFNSRSFDLMNKLYKREYKNNDIVYSRFDK